MDDPAKRGYRKQDKNQPAGDWLRDCVAEILQSGALQADVHMPFNDGSSVDVTIAVRKFTAAPNTKQH